MIRSVHSKVLVGFAGILALSVLASAGAAALLVSRRAGPEAFVDRALRFQAESARDALEQGGPPALERFLGRLDAAFPATHHLLDAAGRDALDGTDRSDLLEGAGPRAGFLLGGEVVMTCPTADRRFWLVVLTEPPGVATALPYFLWVPVGMAGACLTLTYRLLRPVQRLRSAVERFGRGELAARSGVSTRDEFGQLADEFDRMAEQIERLVLAQRQLLQDVSHELRSPLARLAFALELAEAGTDRPAALGRARKEYRRMADLVAELVELTRAEGEPTPAAVGPVALDELVRELAADEELEAGAKGCRIEADRLESATVMGQGQLLRRAVENVLRNAIRHAPTGTEVAVAVREVEGAAEVAIRDSGPGVLEEALEAIFTPFFRVEADRSRDGGGVGLGLTIARRIVAVHGGEITARNRRPGLEVVIRLPRAVARAPYTS